MRIVTEAYAPGVRPRIIAFILAMLAPWSLGFLGSLALLKAGGKKLGYVYPITTGAAILSGVFAICVLAYDYHTRKARGSDGMNAMRPSLVMSKACLRN